MIVLDYLKTMHDNTIVVPPFQSGHLGFIPGRDVQVYLIREFIAGTHCEIVMTPFLNNGNLVRLTCEMHDKRGVVQRLIQSVSSLGINIVAQESSSVHYQKHHFVSMVLDFSTSILNKQTGINSDAVRRYAGYMPNAPMHQQRHVEVFESIIAHCGDVLHWSDTGGTLMPRLNLSPIDNETDIHFHHPARIAKAEREKYGFNHVALTLQQGLVDQLAAVLNVGHQPLKYILVSETEQRKLRAFFPLPGVVPRLLHLGFYHDDKPGTLSALLNPLAQAGFNILTSLQRTQQGTRNVWEAILEYQGKESVPVQGEEQCQWTAKKIWSVVKKEDIEQLKERNIFIALPRYPKRRNVWEGSVELNELTPSKTSRQAKSHKMASILPSYRERLLPMLEESLTSMNSLAIQENDPRWKIINNVKERLERKRPTIFISYPSYAKPYADRLKMKLSVDYDLDEYQKPNAAMILDTVMNKIHNCDGFIGLWHHEENQNTISISPWLPFEYGVARSEGKPWILVRSEKVPERIWKRITPEFSMPFYTDEYGFENEVVPFIREWCKNSVRSL